jgi:hypothetical protein
VKKGKGKLKNFGKKKGGGERGGKKRLNNGVNICYKLLKITKMGKHCLLRGGGSSVK